MADPNALEQLIADARQARPDADAETRIAAGVKSAVGGAAFSAAPGGGAVLATAAKLTVLTVVLGGVLWWGLRPAPTARRSSLMTSLPVNAPIVEAPPPTAVEEMVPRPRVSSAPGAPVLARPAIHRGNVTASGDNARVLGQPTAAHPSEWQLVRKAREALGDDPSASLRLTAEHARLYPRGALAQEREVIAVDALERLGRRGEAKERARAFLQQSPETAHRAHIEAVLARLAP